MKDTFFMGGHPKPQTFMSSGCKCRSSGWCRYFSPPGLDMAPVAHNDELKGWSSWALLTPKCNAQQGPGHAQHLPFKKGKYGNYLWRVQSNKEIYQEGGVRSPCPRAKGVPCINLALLWMKNFPVHCALWPSSALHDSTLSFFLHSPVQWVLRGCPFSGSVELSCPGIWSHKSGQS